MSTASGRCKLSLVQPFSLDYSYADEHVIAFLAGDAEFEAIEAMIQRREEERPLVRVILTRRDNSQIDYINDHAEVIRRAVLMRRETHEANIIATSTRHYGAAGEVILIRLSLQDGRRVELRAASAAAPVAAFGGLTDPRGHAGSSSLPVMWRDASALTSSVSVSVGGKRLAVARGPVGTDAYITEGFRLGVIRASRQELRRVACPDRPEVGAEWRFQSTTGALTYRIADVERDTIRITNGSETVTGRLRGDSVEPQQIRVTAPDGPDGMVLALLPHRRFSIAIGAHADLVTGSFAFEEVGPRRSWVMSPARPAWARPRTTRVTATTTDSTVMTAVSIGT